jgi:hypothetical protein
VDLEEGVNLIGVSYSARLLSPCRGSVVDVLVTVSL